ncbi:uncharacterized protein MONBRDRAFT_22159 [Monosiga brevicollis MX1]|uniref:Uncharacterized protein n=1 Tax=Monosiga brevicollis TaxID=81824 RepID=A9UPR0_MONBE|nr:uncharacterized protein MONBRDRAFT_22159 [Monosiga brevicollis MX1]EDQ92914.1 predicted protein [Monosiga brevicollis MX1]|eukprot:XP_001742676.1 hypothetical protein [Monosiga brevicollis MX1]
MTSLREVSKGWEPEPVPWSALGPVDESSSVLRQHKLYTEHQRHLERRARWAYALHLLVGNAVFYIINSLFLGPLVVFLDRPMPEKKTIAADMSLRPIPPLSPTMMFITIVALMAAIVLATAWDVVVNDKSVVLWTMAAVSGSLGCFGNLMSWAWAAPRGPLMMSALSAGMGAGALIPSLISLVMNPGGHHPTFGVEAFYLIAAVLIACSVVAVWFLDYSHFFAPFWQALPASTASKQALPSSLSINEDEEARTPLLPPEDEGDGDLAAQLSGVPTRGRLIWRMLTICWGASLIFGWQPGLVPYLVPNGHPLIAFQVAGQMYLGALQSGLFAAMLVLALVCNQHQAWFTVVMTLLNTCFAWCYGVLSTRIMITAAHFVGVVYPATSPEQRPADADDRVIQLMGAALSLGSGIGGVGSYFLVNKWLDQYLHEA